jgi:hypothetical protein
LLSFSVLEKLREKIRFEVLIIKITTKHISKNILKKKFTLTWADPTDQSGSSSCQKARAPF